MPNYRVVTFVDSLKTYFNEMLLYNNRSNPLTAEFIKSKIKWPDYIKLIKFKRVNFAFLQVLAADDDMNLIRALANKLNLDVLICPNPSAFEIRPNSLSIKHLYKHINKAADFRKLLIEELIINQSGLLWNNHHDAQKLHIHNEDKISQINQIVLDVDYDYNTWNGQFTHKLLNEINAPIKIYRTASSRIRYYIELAGNNTFTKSAVKKLYADLNQVMMDKIGIEADVSFKRLSHPVWMEGFRILAKSNHKSKLEAILPAKKEPFSLNKLISYAANYIPQINETKESKQETTTENSSKSGKSIYNNSKFPGDFSQPKGTLSFSKFKNLLLTRMVNVLHFSKCDPYNAVFTILGNARYLLECYEVSNECTTVDKVQIDVFLKSITKALMANSSKSLPSILSSQSFEDLAAKVKSLPYDVKFITKKQRPYNDLVKLVLSIIVHDDLRKLANITLDESGKIVTVSANKLDAVFGLAHSSVHDMFKLLESGGFCKKLPRSSNSAIAGFTYEFAEKLDVGLLIDGSIDFILDQPKDVYKIKVHLDPWHESIIKFLFQKGKRYRFWKMMKSTFSKVIDFFDDAVCITDAFRRFNYSFIEPCSG